MKKRVIHSSLAFFVVTIVASILSVSCGGDARDGRLESESHFLTPCIDSCSGDLSCVSGVCTDSCVLGEPDRCGDLAEGAVCTNASVEPGAVAVCDLPCKARSDCTKLGELYDCQAGFCRGPRVDAHGDLYQTGGGEAGGSGVNEGEETNYVYVQPVDFPNGRESFGCSIPDGLFDEERRTMKCTLVRAEPPQVGAPQQDCLAPGTAAVTQQLADAVLGGMVGDACEDRAGDCLEWTLCEYMQISSQEVDGCRSGLLDNALIEPTGFCGIDLDAQMPQNVEIIEEITATCDGQRRAIRLTGGHAIEGSAISEIWMACTVAPS